MKKLRTHSALCAIFLAFFFIAAIADAAVPVRVSIKFILDANGNRPPAGNLNTDDEITADLNWGVNILRRNYTEYQLDVIERVDLSGLSQYYNYGSNATDRDALRAAAMASPSTFHWRTDAINIYITGGTGSAISKFPPDNDIILMNQWCGNTPSCILHEMGHSLNLLHTHQGGGADGCSDTLPDDQNWTKDQIAQNSFGTTYANLNAAQKDQVDLVYNNLMSYHVDEPQLRLSTCQMGRVSSQSYDDRTWLLTKVPIHVNRYASTCGLFELGSFTFPYCSLQNALNAGGLDNKVLVLQQGAYTMTQETINAKVEIVTRSGASTVDRPGVQLWKLPVDLSASKNPAVATAAKAAQDEDTAERAALKEAGGVTDKTGAREKKSALKAEAVARAAMHRANAMKMLHEAEGFAKGDEKLAIQLELAQRYSRAGDCEQAEKYYALVAEGTDQKYLREEALRRAKECGKGSVYDARPASERPR